MNAHAMRNPTDRMEIVVPLDGSPLSEAALPLASLLAKRGGGHLHLTSVHVPFIIGVDVGFPVPDWDEEVRRSEAKHLAEVAKRLKSREDIPVDAELLDGPVGTALANHAKYLGAIIVISTHGRTGLSRAWQGSTADWLSRFAPVPLLLVRPKTDPPHPAEPSVKHVLVALDGSGRAEHVLPDAIRLAQHSSAPITLVRVVNPVFNVPVPIGTPAVPPTADETRTMEDLLRAKDYLDSVAAEIVRDHPGLVVDTQAIAREGVADALVECARAVSADVIAMSTHGRGASRLLVGSVTDGVLRHYSGAILLLGPAAAREIESAGASRMHTAWAEA